MPAINPVDILLAALVVFAAWAGWRTGFVRAALGLLALAAAVLTALHGHLHVAAWLQPRVESVWARPLAFVGLFVLVRVGLGVLLGRVAARLPARVHAHPLHRAAGLLPGALEGLIDATLAVMLLAALPLPQALDDAVRDSALVRRLGPAADRAEAVLTPVFDEAARRALARLTVEPGSRERVDLPFTVQQARPRPDLEARMLELVNEERAREGLQSLAADTALADVARAHSRDMFARGYFSHHSPEDDSVADRLRQAGLRFRVAGENLALAPTLSLAHQGLMKSPGHRANILRPAFRRIGIGILDGGRRGLMVTQVMAS